MSLLSKLFLNKKTVSKNFAGLGEFTHYKDKTDEYWMIESPVGDLPTQFNFGAIFGNSNGPCPDALDIFRSLSTNADQLFSLLNALFFEKVFTTFGQLDISDVKSKFFIKSLTCSSRNHFEFGLHSIENDIFVELFVRDGTVTEVHIDEGCCENQ